MISKYIILTLVVVVVGLSVYSKSLCGTIDSLKEDLVLSKSNEMSLSKAIESQNLAISKYEIDLQNVTAGYVDLLSKPAEIRYETVYKKIPSIKVQSDECKDIKKLLDDIRTAGY